MKRLFTTLTIVSAFLAYFTSAAFAVEVKKEVIVGTDVASTWSKIGGWCALAEWHPAVEKCEVLKDGSVLRRKLTLGGGGIIMERFIARTGNSYSYIIESSPLPVANYASVLTIEPMGKKTKVIWSSTFDAKGKTDDEATGIIGGVYEGGFAALQKDLGK